MRLIALVLVLLAAGCERTVLTTVRAPRLPMSMTSGGEPIEPPAVISVRLALVQWEGAEGASATVLRTQEQAAGRARMITGLARQPGQSFREVQSNYSDGPTTQFLVRRDDERLPPEVIAAAFAMHIGERSLPVETTKGYYILAREDDPATGPSEVYVRHVLVSFIEARMAVEGVERTRDEARPIIESVHESAVANPTGFAALASEFSDEPNADTSGGDLGALTRGQTVPPFERAAFALEVGAVSPVIETAYGYHVIYRYR